MANYNFTKGKKETLKYREISNKAQGVYCKDELIRIFLTDNIERHENRYYDSRYELVK